jgi:hypothetical protein
MHDEVARWRGGEVGARTCSVFSLYSSLTGSAYAWYTKSHHHRAARYQQSAWQHVECTKCT